jgi:hypothetical protein
MRPCQWEKRVLRARTSRWELDRLRVDEGQIASRIAGHRLFTV